MTHAEPGWAAAARAGLFALEPRFAAIETRAGPLPWRRRAPGFPGLLRCICGQMISQAAAESIWARLNTIEGAMEPARFALMDDALLCGVGGLSRPKAAHARSAAQAIIDGRIAPGRIAALDDAAALEGIRAVKGLGPWTAAIYLLFAEDRADIFPPGDVALAAGAAHLLDLPARPEPRALVELAGAWAPHRSMAARLLWHHWRHATGRAAGEA